MKLADLRRLAIRRQLRIHFRIRSGSECVVTEHGVAQVPTLAGVPEFNLEDELAAAGDFLLEPAVIAKGEKSRPRAVSRDELAGLAGTPEAAKAEHEED